MPQTIEETVDAFMLDPKDLLLAVMCDDGREVVSGIKLVGMLQGHAKQGHAVVVKSVKSGGRNTTIETDQGRIIVRSGTEVLRGHVVPTAEEAAEAKAKKDAYLYDVYSENILNWCFSAIKTVAIKRAELADALAGPYVITNSTHRFEAIVEAEATAEIAYYILQCTGWEGRDILHATKHVVETVRDQLIDQGADDGWSGHGISNACKRLTFDTKRKDVSSRSISPLHYALYILNEKES